MLSYLRNKKKHKKFKKTQVVLKFLNLVQKKRFAEKIVMTKVLFVDSYFKTFKFNKTLLIINVAKLKIILLLMSSVKLKICMKVFFYYYEFKCYIYC